LPRAVRTAAVAILTLAVAACGHGKPAVSVSVSVPTAPVTGAVCADLAAKLPASLAGRSRRTTSPSSPRVTAWGSPAVVLRCGVPSAPDSTGDHVTVDAVAWRTTGPAHGVVVWVTTDRSTSLELSVPDSVDDQETLLADLAAAVSSSVSRVPGPASATAASASPLE
jgi:hypothetical protein